MIKGDKFVFLDSKGKEKQLDVIKPEFSIEGLSDNEIEALQLLQEAQREFDKIRFRQNHPDGLEHLVNVRKSEDITFKDFFSSNAGIYEGMGQGIQSSNEFTLNIPEYQGLYPQDMTSQEFENLSEDLRNLKHSLIEKNRDGSLRVIRNSEKFKDHIKIVAQKLRQVSEKVPELQDYVDATINFLQDESSQNSLEHFRQWANNQGNIDFVFDTAQEEGFDLKYGLRGISEGDSFRIAKRYGDISDLMLEYVRELDKRAPWTHKADKFQVPTLKFLDVLSFRGYHVSTPAVTLGQNLPNEQLLKDEVGGVVLIYANVSEAKKQKQAEFYRREFYPHMPKSLETLLPHVENYMTAAHEFGHATSKVLYTGPPAEVFGATTYTIIEEARAEAFSLFAMGELLKDGKISEEHEEIGYYAMLDTMCEALSKEHPRAHRGARNIMFHYLLDREAIIEEKNERDLPIFRFNIPKSRTVNRDLLGILGDIRSEGRKEDAENLIQQYMRTHRWEEFERRFKERGSQGVAALFPHIVGNRDEGFRVEYPSNLSDHNASPLRRN